HPADGPSLATFLEERFPAVGTAATPTSKGPVSLLEKVSDEHPGLAMTWWRDRDHPPTLADRSLYQYRVIVPRRDVELQLALGGAEDLGRNRGVDERGVLRTAESVGWRLRQALPS